jgi:hypothetical protein
MGMNTFKNINDIVSDASIRGIISSSMNPVEFPGIPYVEDEVSLNTYKNHNIMVVEIIEVSEDKETFRGKVTHGYYPEDEKEWIDVGALVEFSREKIGGIYKK